MKNDNSYPSVKDVKKYFKVGDTVVAPIYTRIMIGIILDFDEINDFVEIFILKGFDPGYKNVDTSFIRKYPPACTFLHSMVKIDDYMKYRKI